MSRSRATLARCAFAAWALASLTAAAVAAPDDPAPDPVSRFLAERGLAAHSNAPTSIETLPAGVDPERNTLAIRVREKASEMVLTAMNFIGVSYRRGGESFDRGFDCSGFTQHVFEMSLGLVLPRRANEQAKARSLIKVPRDELEPGDLVFFKTLRRTFSLVGIYIGEGKVIHAPRPGSEVRVEDMRVAYWSKRFTGARRAESALEATAVPASLDLNPATAPLAQ
jgi:cell wall-associated NlpC family hydrolase